ncbi:glycosyltransferase [Vibrio sp. OCN044]|uniref:Glycosyltransferase n=1 Tax=Vibrio tetraodonis subsp. pristinus TaxID=2695891 RepID=A0A6L8LY37_9VIBR|nr:glycosyltransferase family 2 protein [Vibrio tetraodonis]MYM60715.1 glycosyltransferase [Vibrio tetraodonis subsp. pristinus]
MSSNKFSIIIPVFNSECVIKKTIASITSQNHSNYEVIIVDDGSSDSSLEICRELELENIRIKVFSQENSGPNAARNLGIENAVGDYILFLDSDDNLTNNALSNLSDLIDSSIDVDYFNCSVSFYYDNKSENQLCFEEKILLNNEIINESFMGNSLKGICWNKCYSLHFLMENNIRFKEDKLHGRDILFSRLCAYHAKKVVVSNICIVNSHVREGSFSRSFSLKNLESALDLISQHEIYFINKVPRSFLENFAYKHLSYILIVAIFRCETKEQFFEFHKVVKDNLEHNQFYKLFFKPNVKLFIFNFIIFFKRPSWYLARLVSLFGIKPY